MVFEAGIGRYRFRGWSFLRKLRFLRYVFTRDSAFGALARSASFPYGGTIGWFERRRSTRPRLKGNLQTQPLESANQSIACTLRVQAVEEIVAQFLILSAVAQEPNRDNKQLLRTGAHRL